MSDNASLTSLVTTADTRALERVVDHIDVASAVTTVPSDAPLGIFVAAHFQFRFFLPVEFR